jgi:predicted deacetylase
MSALRSGAARRTIAVALHDVEPATFERCALIRDWLDDHGVDRVTLLVIPARDLHPLGERSPEMVGWLRERELLGDAIAQHGFHHLRARRGSSPRELLADLRATGVRSRRGAEFVGLDPSETRRAVESGRRVLKLAGIEPKGFVAPSYAYTAALREVVSARFRWWAELMHLRRAPNGEVSAAPAGTPDACAADDPLLFPPIAFGSAGPLRRAVAPTLVRAGAMVAGPVLRVDLHPADLDHTRRMLALEWVLRHAHGRRAVTYDELVALGLAGRSETSGVNRLAA